MFIFITYQRLLWEIIEYILGKIGLILSSFVHARDSAGKAVRWAPRPWGVSSGPPRKHSSLRAVLDWLAFSDPDAEGQPPRKGKQGKDPLVQCVKTLCCQVAGLIHWLWNTAAVSTTCLHPSLVVLGSSLLCSLTGNLREIQTNSSPWWRVFYRKGRFFPSVKGSRQEDLEAVQWAREPHRPPTWLVLNFLWACWLDPHPSQHISDPKNCWCEGGWQPASSQAEM